MIVNWLVHERKLVGHCGSLALQRFSIGPEAMSGSSGNLSLTVQASAIDQLLPTVGSKLKAPRHLLLAVASPLARTRDVRAIKVQKIAAGFLVFRCVDH